MFPDMRDARPAWPLFNHASSSRYCAPGVARALPGRHGVACASARRSTDMMVDASRDGSRPAPGCLPDALLWTWLHEDAPYGDLTTDSLPLAARPARMVFAARTDCTAACIEEAARLIELCGGRAECRVPSGEQVLSGRALLCAEGAAPALLRAWKVAQTTVEVASGIATATAGLVRALQAAGHPVPVACTRKNVPGTRALVVRAVQAGGGVMHRCGLSETLLVFPEHRALLAPGLWPDALAGLGRRQPEKKKVVEVTTIDDALMAAGAGADVLQLERFTPAQLTALRQRLGQTGQGARPLLAVAGGVTPENAVAYAHAGADMLVTSWPYMAPRVDVKVSITAQEAGQA
jgi:molybdenum transport protein